ncbi:hypothetical protein LCM02_02315 [Lutimonas saemankumensis]|uniref:hypothetical protein n=1 Tax=Lutimonas saemankumensis TaxID=483016 RepID=UPI001CD343B8|nr:hypothetical protein [Lutimonas saemankumensis]MCA0931268.1 hypothetical protein [Lutimonas saemankumensis]
MKNLIFTFIFFILSSLTFGQDFIPIEPNVIKLQEQISSGENTEVIFNYLINNYKMTSEKSELEYYEWDKSKVCAFTQEFENGIKYSVFECKEAGGISVDLELPKINRAELMKWIEKIYEVDKMDIDQNVWKEDNSKFEPKEVNPGCYFEIKEKNNKTIVELYCGC